MLDFQYMIITRKTKINGKTYRPGDIILMDAGSVRKIDPSYRTKPDKMVLEARRLVRKALSRK